MNNRKESEPTRGEMVFLRKGERVFMAFRRFDPSTGQTFIFSDAGLDSRINDGNTLPADELMERLQRELNKNSSPLDGRIIERPKRPPLSRE